MAQRSQNGLGGELLWFWVSLVVLALLLLISVLAPEASGDPNAALQEIRRDPAVARTLKNMEEQGIPHHLVISRHYTSWVSWEYRPVLFIRAAAPLELDLGMKREILLNSVEYQVLNLHYRKSGINLLVIVVPGAVRDWGMERLFK